MSSDAGSVCRKAEAGAKAGAKAGAGAGAGARARARARARAEGAKRRAWPPTGLARCGWVCWTRREPVHGGSMCAIHGAQRSCRPTHTAPSTLGWSSKESQSRASREPVESQSRASREPVKRRQAPIGACLLLLACYLLPVTCYRLPKRPLWLAQPSIQICLASGGQALTGPSGRQGWRPRAPKDGFTARPGRAWPPLANTEMPVSQSRCLCLCLCRQSAKPAKKQILTAAANAASRRTFRGSADAGSSDPRSVRRPHRLPRPALCAPYGTPPRWR